MNPLDMTGPEFLQFYLLYGLAGLALACALRFVYLRNTTSGDLRWKPGYYPRGEDAYGIALLRGGRKEAARAVLGRLVTAGLLEVQDRELRRAPGRREEEAGLSPLERSALQALGAVRPAARAEAVVEAALRPHLETLEEDLRRQGLVPSREQRKGLRSLLGLALLAVPGLGVVKLLVAVEREKSNVGFLILMILFYTLLTVVLKAPRLTRAGESYLAWLRESHRELVRRIEDGRRGDASDALLATGIFGLAVLPGLTPLHRQLEPRGDGGSAGASGCGGGDSGGGDGGGGGCGGCGGGGD